jgi:hypothetical protein
MMQGDGAGSGAVTGFSWRVNCERITGLGFPFPPGHC